MEKFDICYLDMDGVITDFVGTLLKMFDKTEDDLALGHFDLGKLIGESNNAIWRAIRAKGENFWTEIEPYPWNAKLIELLEKVSDEIVICTEPDQFVPPSWSGKRWWLNQHLPGYEVIMMKSKKRLARPGTLIIDDKETTVNAFTYTAFGGHGILFPQPWNITHQLVTRPYFDRVAHVADVLRNFGYHV